MDLGQALANVVAMQEMILQDLTSCNRSLCCSCLFRGCFAGQLAEQSTTSACQEHGMSA
jgi:hypothetical protein